jgi:hypothetical protein
VEFSIRLHRAMAKETRHKAFARFLEKRATRLENLWLLDRAIARYTELTGKPPTRLQQLVDRRFCPPSRRILLPCPTSSTAEGKAQSFQAARGGSGRAP